MKKSNFISQIVIYFLLIGGAMLFSAPLIWMFSTAVKPIEQTMSLPPSWLPYQYLLQKDGQEIPVKIEGKLVSAAFQVHLAGMKSFVIIPADKVKNGVIKLENGNTVIPADIKLIPASKDNMFIIAASENNDKKYIVPAHDINRVIHFRWENFSAAVESMTHFPLYLRNTLLLCFITVVGTVSSSALAAYGFSRIEWKGRDKVFLLALCTMMIPFPVLMVPLYCLFKALGMIGTLQPLWIGSFCAGAFNVFLLRQFFIGIPQALSDAARIDGCSEFKIFFDIILPISKPALMVVGLFQFMGTWNDFLGPLIYLTDQRDYTLALGLQFFQSQSGGTEWNYLMAASFLVVIPVLILFFFTQKSFIEGISTTGVKG
ncbi:MAG: carbohydrate ABC transporter permease [Victivallales bacterium]|nr:carbohydrate ABC transporter permease [Victivallales bacterium]